MVGFYCLTVGIGHYRIVAKNRTGSSQRMPLCDRNPLLQFCFFFDVVMCIVLNEALHCDDRFLPDAPLEHLIHHADPNGGHRTWAFAHSMRHSWNVFPNGAALTGAFLLISHCQRSAKCTGTRRHQKGYFVQPPPC